MTEKVRTSGIIEIDENYCIKVMPHDYALAKISTGRDGKQRYEPFAYYWEIGKCLREYLRTVVHSDLREKPVISLSEALETVQSSVQRCIGVISTRFPDYDVVKKGNSDGTKECPVGAATLTRA